jgi:glycosyltransferase involved in cell wall biosynthesis
MLPGMRKWLRLLPAGGRARHDLILLDDVFPHLLSAFRIVEFNAYLTAYPASMAYSTGRGFACLNETRAFPDVVEDYERRHPALSGRVAAFESNRSLAADLACLVFLNNARSFLGTLESNRIPFVFTLYPGGGFDLDQPRTDEALRLVFGSRCFRSVLVTQTVTRDYLLARSFCDPGQIEFAYGGAFPAGFYRDSAVPKRLYGRDKRTLDLCFVAHKYMPGGRDKGYDIFVAVAKALAGSHPEMRFHVVGPYDASDLDVADLGDRIRFYGSRSTDFFPDFYAGMDIILSPNVAFLRSPGQFDGFPTGCCIEAGLCGVAVFCSDPLRLNFAFEDGREIVIVPGDARETAARIEAAVGQVETLYQLAERGRQAFARVFGESAQMEPRLRLLARFLAAPAAATRD